MYSFLIRQVRFSSFITESTVPAELQYSCFTSNKLQEKKLACTQMGSGLITGGSHHTVDQKTVNHKSVTRN